MTDATSITTACPRWIKILLGLSLALNLGIAGVVGGFMMRTAPMRDGHAGMGYAAPYVIALPREDRRAVFGAVRSNDALPNRGDRRAQYSEMLDALGAEPFDRDRVQAILSRQGTAVAQIQDVSQAAWLAVVTEMDAEERTAYVARIKDVLKRGKRGKRKDRK